jgi:hypothetical protein
LCNVNAYETGLIVTAMSDLLNDMSTSHERARLPRQAGRNDCICVTWQRQLLSPIQVRGAHRAPYQSRASGGAATCCDACARR